MDEEFNHGYEEGIREAEKHLVSPDVIGSINDQHIDEMNRMQDDYCKQIDSLESRIKELEDKYEPKERPTSCPCCHKLWNPKPEDVAPTEG